MPFLLIACKSTQKPITPEEDGFSLTGDPLSKEDYSFGFGGDLNDDGTVNVEDLSLLQDALEGVEALYAEYDINLDGMVNEEDICHFASHS